MTEKRNAPRFSDDPRGGTYIDNGMDPVFRVEDEAPAPVEAPAQPEVTNNV